MRYILLAFMLTAGCAGRETRQSRERLNCVYSAQFSPGLTGPERVTAEKTCAEMYR